MDAAAQPGLALDIDDSAAPLEGLRGDARGSAELVVAKLDDREPIDLADYCAGRVHHDGAIDNGLAHALLVLAGAVDAFADGLLHVGPCDQRMTGADGPEGCFLDDIGHEGEAGGQLALVLHDPRAVFHNLCDRAHIEVGQSELLAAVADIADDFLFILLRPGHLDREVRPHLEEFLELLVVGKEQVIRWQVTDEYDFDIQRNRLRCQHRGGQDRGLLAAFLDADALVAQRLLEPFPSQRLAHHNARIEQQIPAVSPVERTWPDEAIVRDQGADFGAHLHPADEVRVGRVCLDDDRRTL